MREEKMTENKCVIGANAVEAIADFAAERGARLAFLCGDENTYPLAAGAIGAALAARGIGALSYVLPAGIAEPDERAVGSLFLHFEEACDLVIGIGSGVVNDLCKLLAHRTHRPYAIFATAPSMDGWASPLSSMVRGGMKVSIPTKRAELIAADPAVLCRAPEALLRAGLGDMLAKYISICEWRIGHLITGEAYDETIAADVRRAVRACVASAGALLSRDAAAAASVFEGLVLAGEAMARAGCSRPASGGEHYLSHLWDMRALAFGTESTLHGLQCAVSTSLFVRLYRNLPPTPPSREAALAFVRAFDLAAHNAALRDFLGEGAEPMITLEKKEGKYDPARHEARLDRILSHYHEILAIVDEELPTQKELDSLYEAIGLPTTPPEGGVLARSLRFGGDIRDKYVLPRLLWDLGLLDKVCLSLEDQ